MKMIEIKWKVIELVTVMLLCLIIDFIHCDELLMGGHLKNHEIASKSIYDQKDYDNDDHRPLSSSLHQLHKLVVGANPFTFNGGKPFSLEKDPVTGQINFNNAPPFKALNYTGLNNDTAVNNKNNNNNLILEENNIVSGIREKNENVTFDLPDSRINDEDHEQTPNEINPYTPSFHDFLNLPIRYSDHEKYTSDKYPLISSSYANTKVQGSPGGHNAYFMNNHKNYQLNHSQKPSTSPSYTNTQKLFASKPVAASGTTEGTTTISITTIPPPPPPRTTTMTLRITTPRPTTRRSVTPRTTTTKKVLTSTQPITTWKPSRPIERYSESYESDAMLPIEQMQSIAIKLDEHPYGSFERVDYTDGYEDYDIEEKSTSPPFTSTATTTSESTTSTSTTPVTATKTTITELPLLSSISTLSDVTEDISLLVKGSPLPFSNLKNDNPQQSFSSVVVQPSNNVLVPSSQNSFVSGNLQDVDFSYSVQSTALPEPLYGENAQIASPVGPDMFQHDLSIGRPAIETELSYLSPIDLPTQQKWWFNNEQSKKSQSLAQNSKDDRVNVMAGYRIVFPTSGNPLAAASQSLTTSIPTIINTTLPEKERLPLSEILTPPVVNNIQRPDQAGQRLHYYQSHHHRRYHNQKPIEIPSRVQRLPTNTNNFKVRNSGGHIEKQPQISDSLPNILPQFRPNVRTPQRRGGETIGTVIIQSSQKNPNQRVQVRPPLQSVHKLSSIRQPQFVSHLQRLNPPPSPSLPIHKLRLPPPVTSVADSRGQSSENVQIIQKVYQPITNLDIQIDERTRSGGTINSIHNSRLNDDNNNKNDDVIENSNDSSASPPGPPVFMKRKLHDNTQIATLQMIQQHKFEPETHGSTEKIAEDQELQGDRPGSNRRVDESSVYVVYPVKGALGMQSDTIDSDDKDIEESVVVGTLGAQRPLPPDTLSHDNGNDDKIFQSPPLRHGSDFPYPLAKPDPSMLLGLVKEKPLLIPNEHNNNNNNKKNVNYYDNTHGAHKTDTEQVAESDSVLKDQENKDTSVNIIPYVQDNSPFSVKYNAISTTLHLVPKIVSSLSASSVSTETPIAYVYTPTTSSSVHRPNEIYEKNPVLLPSQQPSSSSSSAPSPQNFMAPFVASLSAEIPTTNGWNVVHPLNKINKSSGINTDNNQELSHEKGNATIFANTLEDRIDKDKLQTDANDFNAENFKPELFSGFRPIFELTSDTFDRFGNEKAEEDIEVIGKLGKN